MTVLHMVLTSLQSSPSHENITSQQNIVRLHLKDKSDAPDAAPDRAWIPVVVNGKSGRIANLAVW